VDRHSNLLVRFAQLIIVAITACSLGLNASAESSERQPFAAAWFEDSAATIEGLNKPYSECLANAENNKSAGNAKQIQLGRLAFNSPRLLGGQASRMGVSCASCHPAGRSSKHFFIKQISDQAGSADITHSFFSSAGGDGIFNAKPIPDLADINTARFKDRSSPEFSAFLINLIEVEFDGQKTAAPIFEALQYYLININEQHCTESVKKISRRFEHDWQQVQSAIELLKTPDYPPFTRYFISQSGRAGLEVIYRNFGLTPNANIDRALINLSRQLEDIDNGSSMLEKHKSLSEKSISLLSLLRSNLDYSAYSERAIDAYYMFGKLLGIVFWLIP